MQYDKYYALGRKKELKEWIANAVYMDSADEIPKWKEEILDIDDEIEEFNQYQTDIHEPDATGQNQWRQDHI